MNNKQWTIFSLILVLVIFCLLVDLPRVPSWIPGHNWFSNLKVHLGLDLQGGNPKFKQQKQVMSGELLLNCQE